MSMVNTHHIGGHGVLARSGDDNALGASYEVLLGILKMGKAARGLYDIVDSEILPRELGGVFFGADGYFVGVDIEGLFVVRDGMGIGAMNGVVLEEIGQMVGRNQVVYSDNLKSAGLQRLS